MSERIEFLIGKYKETFETINDLKFEFLHPEEGSVIRTSDHLYYFGYSNLVRNQPELGFRIIAGHNNPLEDFGDLADRLENKLMVFCES